MITYLAAAVVSGFVPSTTLPQQPTDLAVIHRDGQSFVTWTEVPNKRNSLYRLYRSDVPVGAATLAQATLLAEVPFGSSEFYADHYFVPGTTHWAPRYVSHYVIEHGGSELDADEGLVVWTLSEDDFGGASSGLGHYAVTIVDPLLGENLVDFDIENTASSVPESVSTPRPVLTATAQGGQIEIYTQFMDLRNWNPTFDAANEMNSWYGLSTSNPKRDLMLQYAYAYAVVLPYPSGCATATGSGPKPLVVRLHGHGGCLQKPKTADQEPKFCDAYRIYPVDQNDTWWFGFARDHDYRHNLFVGAGDTIVNYTEQRILRMIMDLIQDPVHGPNIDPNRVYIHGHSMGGSGSTAFALRYPNLFAAAYSGKGYTDYESAPGIGGIAGMPDAVIKWGDPELDLPVLIEGPFGLADPLAHHSGSSIWDWQDHQQNLLDRVDDEIVPFGLAHALNDTVIDWGTQGQPVYQNCDSSHRAWAGAILSDGHVPTAFQGLPPTLGLDWSGTPFAGFQVRKDETVPGLSNSTANLPLPPTTIGEYFLNIEWSATWNPWDSWPQDSANLWSLSMRTTDASQLTVDVTPRRLQSFLVAPEQLFAWEQLAVGTAELLEVGAVVADASGLLTVPNFTVDGVGSTLVIEPASAVSDLLVAPQTISLMDGGSPGFVLLAGPAHAGRNYLLLGSVSGTSPGLPIDGVVLPLVFDPYTSFVLSQVDTPSHAGFQGTLDGDGTAEATLTVPGGQNPGLAGQLIHHAYLVFGATGAAVHASAPVTQTFVP